MRAPENRSKSDEKFASDAPEPEVLEADVIEDVEESAASAADSETRDSDHKEESDELFLIRKENEALRDKYVRLQAEWDNFRKRTAVERVTERARATEKLVGNLLPVLDDLERAIEHADTASETSLREGIVAVQAKLADVLKREGVTVIDPLDQPFDALLHQAVGNVEDTSVPDETVAQVYQKGYMMGDKVIRPSMVTVATGGPKISTEERQA